MKHGRRDTRTRRLAGVGSIASIVLLAAAYASLRAAPAPLPSGMAVSVSKAKSACFADTVELVGAVVPRNEILVRPSGEGLQLSAISVEAGDTITSGQLLAKLAPPNGSQHGTIEIDAPSKGIVLAAPTVIGATVSARGEPLFRIAADGDLDLSAEVAAKDATRLAVGQTAKVKLPGLDDAPGRVRLVASTVDPSTQLGTVRIALEHDPQMRVGAFGRAMVDVANSCGVSIPLSALLFDPDGPVVQVIRDDRIETRRVSIGLFGSSSVEIRDGLSAGDVVVQRAGAFLREGDRVRPIAGGE